MVKYSANGQVLHLKNGQWLLDRVVIRRYIADHISICLTLFYIDIVMLIRAERPSFWNPQSHE